MKKIILTLVALNSLIQFASAQTPAKLWEAFFNGALTGKDEANCILTDALGNVFVTGQSFQTFNGGNFTTIKYSPNGIQQWADHYSNTQASYKNYGLKLVIDKWQDIYAVGTTAIHDGDLAVCKYNSAGRIWAKNYEPYWFSTYDDYGIDIDVDSAGYFYANAKVVSPSGNLDDMYIMKCDSSGIKIMDENFTSASADDFPTAISVAPNGTLFALCNSFNFFGTATYDIFTINYLSNFNHNWESKYNGSGNAADYGTFLKADNNNNTFVCGTTDGGTTDDMVMYKQNQYGTRLWLTTYNGSANENDTAIAETWLPNGFVVISGKSRELLNGNVMDAVVTMVVDSGTVVWANVYYGSDSLGAAPSQMVTDAQGNIYICGFENISGGTRNGCILKYDSNGTLLWNISYDGGMNLSDKFNSIALDYNNDIIVTGQTFTSTANANYVTVKYANGPTGLADANDLNDIKVYPNPASEYLNLTYPSMDPGRLQIVLIDLQGRPISVWNAVNDKSTRLNLNREIIGSGVYILEFRNQTQVRHLKISIQ